MIEVAREAVVAAPVERVWELVADVSQLPDWFAFAERAELLGGDGVGRRQRIHGRWGSRGFEIDQVVTAFEHGRLLEWRHEAERFEGGKSPPRFARETRFAIELAPADSGTQVRLVSRQEPMGPVRGLVLRLMAGREVGGKMDRSLERLAAAFA